MSSLVKVLDSHDLRANTNVTPVALSLEDFQRLVRRICPDVVNHDAFMANLGQYLHEIAERYSGSNQYSDADLAKDLDQIVWDVTFLNSAKVVELTTKK